MDRSPLQDPNRTQDDYSQCGLDNAGLISGLDNADLAASAATCGVGGGRDTDEAVVA
jgi:hypothetical protein